VYPADSETSGGKPARPKRRLAALVERAASVVLDLPLLAVCAGLAAIAVVRNGLGVYKFVGTEIAIAKSLPYPPHVPLALGSPAWVGTLMESMPLEILARLLGITTQAGYVWLYVVVLTLGVAGLLAWVHRTRGDRATRLAALALAASPALTTTLRWLGGYDAPTVLLLSFLAIAGSWPALLGLSVALGLFHFWDGVFVAVALMIVGPKRAMSQKRRALVMFGGLAAGKLALSLYLAAVGVTLSRTDYTITTWTKHLADLAKAPPIAWAIMAVALVYAMFGASWAWLLPFVRRVGKGWPQTRGGIAALLFLLLPTVIADDVSRNYAILALPVLLTLILVADRYADEQSVRLLAGWGFLGLLLPAGWVFLYDVGFPLLTSPGGLLTLAGLAAAFAVLLWLVRPANPGRRGAA
jgi:hypothetical protein